MRRRAGSSNVKLSQSKRVTLPVTSDGELKGKCASTGENGAVDFHFKTSFYWVTRLEIYDIIHCEYMCVYLFEGDLGFPCNNNNNNIIIIIIIIIMAPSPPTTLTIIKSMDSLWYMICHKNTTTLLLLIIIMIPSHFPSPPGLLLPPVAPPTEAPQEVSSPGSHHFK